MIRWSLESAALAWARLVFFVCAAFIASASLAQTPDDPALLSAKVIQARPAAEALWHTGTLDVPRDLIAPFTLRIVNGTQDGAGRATQVWVTVNGETVLSPADFVGAPQIVEKAITLNPGANSYGVRAEGAGGELLALSIAGTRTVTQPTGVSPEVIRIVRGAVANIEIRLTPGAIAAGSVAVSSADTTVATVPASVSFPAGASSVVVPVSALGIGTTVLSISGNGASVSRTVIVERDAARLVKLAIPGSPVLAGSGAAGEIHVSSAPATDLTVALASSDASILLVPRSVVVPAGRTSATFRMDAVGSGQAVVTATTGAQSLQARVTAVTAQALTLQVSPGGSALELGGTASYTVRVAPAQPRATVVTLTASPASAIALPSRVEIPAGATEVGFPVRALGTGTAEILATSGDSTGSAMLQVVPSLPRLIGATPAAISVARGAAGRATISIPVAQTTNTDVDVVSEAPAVAGVPSRVVIPAGQRSVSFEVRGVAPGATVIRMRTAASEVSARVTVIDSGAALAELSPATVVLQPGVRGRLTLRLSAAVATPTTISLSAAGNGAVDLPASIEIPAGSTHAHLPVGAISNGDVTIRATLGATSLAARVLVDATAASVAGFDAASLQLPKGRVGSVSLLLDRVSSTPVTVSLQSSDFRIASAPLRVVVPAGAISVDIPLRANGPGVVSLRAVAGTSSVATNVEVVAAELDNLVVTPMVGTVYVGDTRTLALQGTLSDGLAQAVTSATWNSSDVAVAAVSSQGVVRFLQPGAARITAIAGGLVTQAAFTVLRKPALTLTPGTSRLARGASRQFTVDAGGTVAGLPLEVTITQSGAGRLATPVVVTIPTGQSSATFSVTGETEGIALLRVSAARYASASSAVEVVTAPPKITSLSPSRAPAGSTVVITGEGFSASVIGNRVTLGGAEAIVTSATADRIVVIVPQNAGRGPAVVQNAAGSASGGDFVPEGADLLASTDNLILTADGPLATLKGVFTPVASAYRARSQTVLVGSGSAIDSITFQPPTRPGPYRIHAWWPQTTEATGTIDAIVTHKDGTTTIPLEQSQNPGLWVTVGTFEGTSAKPIRLEFRGRSGVTLVGDSVRFEYAGATVATSTTASTTSTETSASTSTARTTAAATTSTAASVAPPSPTSTGTALAELLSMVAEIPEGQWVRANLNSFSEAWTPLDQRPIYYPGNPGIPNAVLGAWASVAWDTNRGDLYAFGGGHANYAGNEVYRWRGSTLMWERISLPSEISQDALGNYRAIDGPENAPPSAHTYDNNIYLPIIDRFVTFGGAAYNNGGRWEMQVSGTTERPYGPYFFDQSRSGVNKVGGTTGSHVQRVGPFPEVVGGNMWENRDIFVNIPGGVGTEGVFRDGCTAYHVKEGKDVVYIGQTPSHGTGLRLYEYVVTDLNNPALDTWRWIGREPMTSQGPFGQSACDFDPNMNLFVRRGNKTAPFVYWDVANGSPTNVEVNVFPQDPTGEFAAFLNSQVPPDAVGFTDYMLGCGFDFDPVRRNHVMWCGDGAVWVLTPPATVSPNGWVIRKQQAPANTSMPNGEVGAGIIGKWKYIANIDAFLGVQDRDNGNIWIYKPIGWQPPVPINLRPAVQLTSPANGFTVSRPNNITMQATASDPDGTVARVEFYAGTTKLGEDATAPYQFTWVSPPQGTYSIVARAVDNLGLHRNTTPITVTVAPAPTTPPVVRLVRPSNNQAVTVGVPVTIEAVATDSDGTIAKVEFFHGTTKIGEDTTAPYSLQWTPPQTGSYVLTAFATDNLFGETTSTPVTVNAVTTQFTTVTLQDGFGGYTGTRDAWMYDAQPTANTGTLPYLQIAQSQFENLVRFAVFQSEGGPVPDGAVITSARLHLYKSTSAYDATYRAFRLLKNWDEATVTFNQPAAGQSWSAAGARGSGTDFLSVHDGEGTQGWDPGWLEIDLTTAMQQLAVNPTANYGWKVVMSAGNGNIKQFHSSEYATITDLRPKLVISYQPPAGPQVSITSPVNGTTVNSPANFTITANAFDSSGGTITKVEFFAGTTKLGEDLSSPYSLAWNSVAPGTYALTAVATNGTGATRTSGVVSVTVNGPNVPPTVNITQPANGSQATSGGVVNFLASAADGNGSVSKVEFFQGATKIAEDLVAPYAASWIAPAQTGPYTFTAVATDNDGAQTTSTAITVNVTAPTGGAITTTLQEGLGGYAGTRDAYLYDYFADGNAGAIEYLQVAQNQFENLIRFAIFQSEGGPIPNGATITSATLSLYKSSAYDATYRVHRLLQSWDEATVTFNSRTTGSPWTAPGARGAGTDFLAAHDAETTLGWDPGWLDLNVTGALQAFASGAAVNNGWKIVMAAGNGNLKQFHSSEFATDPSLRPKLLISYTTSPGPQVSITSPASNATFTAPASVTITADATDGGGGTISKVEFFAGATKLGEDLVAPYSFSWTGVAQGNYSLTAVATNNSGATRTSTAVNIVVNPANTPPTVSITAPANNANVSTGATVGITATATDTGGSVTRVEFFAGATKIGEDLTAPYSLNWVAPTTAGTVVLTAVATDNAGAQTTSAAVNVNVAAPNTPPTVSITAPANNASVTTGSSVSVSATAADSGGSVARVEFFAGATKIGEDTTSPYSITWTAPATAGTVLLTAVATDNAGAQTTSAGVTVSVLAGTGTSGTVTLQDGTAGYSGTRDAYLYNYFADGNAGSATSLQVGLSEFENLIKFAIFQSEGGPVPNGATITSAQLSFYKYTNAYDATYRVHRLLQSWDESTVTYNSRTTGQPWAVPGARGSGTDFVAAHDAQTTLGWNAGWLNLDVTAGVQAFASGAAQNHGWKLVMSSGNGNLKQFHSSEHATDPTLRPKLVVTYTQSSGPQVSITTPTTGTTYTAPATVIIGVDATDGSGGTITKVEFYAGATRLGEDLTAPYLFTWTNVVQNSFVLTAVATNSAGATRTSAPVSIVINPANTPPTVSITSPANNATVTTGASVTIDATAADSNGSVSRVEFFAGGTKIGEDSVAPYSLTWTAPATAGAVVLTAVATDNAGAQTTSAAVNLSVTAPNTPPTVAITAPANNASVTAGSTVTVTASAGDPGGSVARVEFYVGVTKIGEDATAPYSVNWTAPTTVGSYALAAVATDNDGAQTTSTVINVNVVAPVAATVTLQDGLNGYSGTRDAYLYSFFTDGNAGSVAFLQIGQAQFENLVRFAIFQSEGGPVPNGATITSARLSFYKFTNAYDGVYRAHRLLQSWDESTVTWNSRTTGQPWAAPGARGSGTDFLAAHDAQASLGWNAGWLELDVTTGVQAFSSGSATNNGWKLVMTSGNGNIKQFHSSEYATDATRRPKLVITYSTGP